MEWDTRSIVYVSSEAITGLLTIIGNMFVLVAIVKTRRLHTVTNVFIANLAIADIFVGVIVAPFAALSFLGLPRDVHGCIFINSAILIFTNASILMLVGVTVERFVSIRLPFVYDRLLTTERALWFNAGLWTIGLLLGLIPVLGWNVAPDTITKCTFQGVISMEFMVYFHCFGLFVLPFTIVVAIYAYIFYVIKREVEQINALQVTLRGKRRSRVEWKREVTAAKWFALLVALFTVFWLPINVINCFLLLCPACVQSYDLVLAAVVMSHLNSSANPFLYAASDSRIKRAIKAMCCNKYQDYPLDDTTTDMSSWSEQQRAIRFSSARLSLKHLSSAAGRIIEDARAQNARIDTPIDIEDIFMMMNDV